MFRVALACALALSACTLDFDAVGPLGGEGAGGGVIATGGSGDGGKPVSDCSDGGGQCLPLPPGFDGAVVLNAGCGSAAKVFDGFASYSFDDATCGCSCSAEKSCALPGSAQVFGSALCQANGGTATFSVVDPCLDVPTLPEALSVQLMGPPEPPSCDTHEGAADVPPIEWGEPLVGCAFDSLGCGDDLCLPSGDERYCFYRAIGGGPVPCPAGLTDTPVFEASDLTDTRDCDCDCGGKLSDGCGTPVWTLYSDDACATQVGVVQSLCGGVDKELGSVEVAVASQVTCEQPEGATGTVVGTPTLQLCCSP
ncbi:MAG: hypothetical protein JNK04_00935 [Myxococcales bacterium]|nr:hypothetical protein [Myxococcales bacterium]